MMKHGFTTGIQTPNRGRCSGTRQLSSTQEVPHSTVRWKVMATIFWDYKGVLLVDYLPRKTTMTGPYYGEVLTNMRRAVKEKRREMLLLHDNAPAHVSSCTGRSQGHQIWAAVSPTLITQPGTQRLLPISTSEAAPSRNKVFRWRWAQAGHGVVSRQHALGILFRRNKGTFWQMSEMYWYTGRLHWKIM